MPNRLYQPGLLGGVLLATVQAASAQSVAIVHRDLSMDGALAIATAAIADCKARGWAVSASVVGRMGEIIVQIRGDDAPPHTLENSWKKAFTARTFRAPSGDMEERLRKNPQMGGPFLTGFTTGRGALPIKIGDEVIGAAGISGAPGGEKDEACVQTGLDKLKDQMK